MAAKFAKPTLYGYTYERKHCFRRRGAAGLAENAEVKINRLTMADATIGDFILQSGNITDVAASYGIGDEIISYDRIGNIQSLERRVKGTGLAYTEVEFYNYVYSLGTNELTQATGMGGTATRMYTYDANEEKAPLSKTECRTGSSEARRTLLTDNYRNITGTEYGRAAYAYHLDKGSTDIDYLYSLDDQRIFKREVAPSGNTEDYYLIDAMEEKALLSKREAEPDGRDSRPITVALRSNSNAGTAWEYYISGAEREARIVPNSAGTIQIVEKEPSFYLYDDLGNTRVVYLVDGYLDSVVAINTIDFVADYFPYGKIARKFVSGEEERFLTTQHERDEETGLDYRGARYYDSDVARFLSLDPLAAEFASWSAYNYVLGNPVMLVDENGKWPINPWLNKQVTFSLNFTGLIEYNSQSSKRDNTLYDEADPLINRELHEPDGIWSSGSSSSNTDKTLSLTTDHSRQILSSLYGHSIRDFSSACAPCDGEWRYAAASGSYTYISNVDAENTFTGINYSYAEIVGVKDNVVTDITALRRDASNDSNKFKVVGHTHYDIVKTKGTMTIKRNWGWFGTSESKYSYDKVTVTRTYTEYKGGKAMPAKVTEKTYNSNYKLISK